MSKGTPVNRLSGKIAATPNPIPLIGRGCTKITWETNDPLGAEIHVLTPDDGEKLVTKGLRGSVEVSWIAASKIYTFNLYSSTEPSRRLGHVNVRRNNGALEGVLDELAIEAQKGNIDFEQLARFVGNAASGCVHNPRFPEFFRLWEKHGVASRRCIFINPFPTHAPYPSRFGVSQVNS